MYQIEKAKTPFSHLKGKIIFDSNFSEIPHPMALYEAVFKKTFLILDSQPKSRETGQLILKWFLRKLFWKQGNWQGNQSANPHK